jgi:guanine deaminase
LCSASVFLASNEEGGCGSNAVFGGGLISSGAETRLRPRVVMRAGDEGTLAIRGQTLSFRADPFSVPPEQSVDFCSDGAVVIRDGRIVEVGQAKETLARYPGAPVENYAGDLIMAGFVDCHAHYPQTGIIASYGAQLLEWLEKYTFPEEAKFSGADYAAMTAEIFLDETLRNGITTSSIYCTSHPASVDAIFAAAQKRKLRTVAGKCMMDRNCPQSLQDTPRRGYDETKALIEKWHGTDRLVYSVSPRFAITSTPEQLEAAGAVWKEHPSCLMQTHLSENKKEVAWISELFPDEPDYLGVYERYGLLGPGSNFGHAIYLSDREIALLKETGSGVSHCPTSNTFIGSGLFDMKSLREGPQSALVGLGTDVGGGSSFSMFATMKAAYEIAQLRGASLHPAKAYYLATMGSAAVLRLTGKAGNLAAGYEADIIVIDLKSTPVIEQRMRHAASIWEALFVQMILADDRAVRAVYVEGSKVAKGRQS